MTTSKNQTQEGQRSDCHDAELIAVIDGEGTGYYKCAKCGRACDWHTVSKSQPCSECGGDGNMPAPFSRARCPTCHGTGLADIFQGRVGYTPQAEGDELMQILDDFCIKETEHKTVDKA